MARHAPVMASLEAVGLATTLQREETRREEMSGGRGAGGLSGALTRAMSAWMQRTEVLPEGPGGHSSGSVMPSHKEVARFGRTLLISEVLTDSEAIPQLLPTASRALAISRLLTKRSAEHRAGRARSMLAGGSSARERTIWR